MNPFKKARLLSGKRQIDVTNQVGIWPARLSLIENGLARPQTKEIHLLAGVYDLNPDELIVMDLA